MCEEVYDLNLSGFARLKNVYIESGVRDRPQSGTGYLEGATCRGKRDYEVGCLRSVKSTGLSGKREVGNTFTYKTT